MSKITRIIKKLTKEKDEEKKKSLIASVEKIIRRKKFDQDKTNNESIQDKLSQLLVGGQYDVLKSELLKFKNKISLKWWLLVLVIILGIIIYLKSETIKTIFNNLI